VVDGDELGAIGKGGFDLDIVNHFWDAFHDFIATNKSGA
jgi:hypothetical protein